MRWGRIDAWSPLRHTAPAAVPPRLFTQITVNGSQQSTLASTEIDGNYLYAPFTPGLQEWHLVYYEIKYDGASVRR